MNPSRLACTLVLPVSLLACFEDVGPFPSSSDDSTGQGDGDGDGDGAPGDGDGTPGDGDGTPGDGDGTPGDGDGTPGDGDGAPIDPGPQLVSSSPAGGDQNAPLSPYVLLRFDRPVSAATATGKILAAQGNGPAQALVVQPCPDLDPSCLAGLYPMAFSVDGHLPADTQHVVTVATGFEDPDGNATLEDQVVDFKTFAYEADWFNDTPTLDGELGGLEYDPASQALFIVGVNANLFYGPRIRKVPMPNGMPQAATTVFEAENLTGGPWTYGLDRAGTQLMASLSYAGEVRVFNGLAGNMLTPVVTYNTTGLSEPDADLGEVWSTARGADGRTYFAWSDFNGNPNPTGIIQRTNMGEWSMFNSGQNLWNVSNDGVMLTLGVIANAEYLLASADGVIYKFRTADNQLVAQYDVEPSWGRDMAIDPTGRLWYGTQDGVWGYDVTGDMANLIAAREGIECGRMAIRSAGMTTHVYCAGFRDPAIISHLPIDTP